MIYFHDKFSRINGTFVGSNSRENVIPSYDKLLSQIFLMINSNQEGKQIIVFGFPRAILKIEESHHYYQILSIFYLLIPEVITKLIKKYIKPIIIHLCNVIFIFDHIHE